MPSLKKIPALDIITSTEKAALMIERDESTNGSCVKAESLRHSVSNILLRSFKKNLPSNLTKSQQLALRDLKANDDVKVVPFDKDTGFTVLHKSSMFEKIEEHLKDARVVEKDPTDKLRNKFQRTISALKKRTKLTHCYFEIFTHLMQYHQDYMVS